MRTKVPIPDAEYGRGSLASSKSNTGNGKPQRSLMWTSALSVINRADLQQLHQAWSLGLFF